eukprot:scaffold53198_cov27-Prasinocladus_malaysianus.AAC.4
MHADLPFRSGQRGKGTDTRRKEAPGGSQWAWRRAGAHAAAEEEACRGECRTQVIIIESLYKINGGQAKQEQGRNEPPRQPPRPQSRAEQDRSEMER